MKTPDEIKKGLECGFCHECPYENNELETVEECARQVHKDAIAYIQQLESRLAQVERERDAAVRDLNCNWKCAICKKFTKPVDKCPHYRKCGLSYMFWEWRGVCPENTKCDADA